MYVNKKSKKVYKKTFIFVIITETREFFFCRDKMYKHTLIFTVYMEFKDWFSIYKGEK